MVVVIANVLIRQAQKTENARSYLDELISELYSTLSRQQFGQIVSVTVNGKSTQFQSARDRNGILDQIAAAQLALSCLERGLLAVPTTTYPLFR